ncbi:MAG: SPOR domain-containing protein [Deltaproteobacteria bacterium]|nr:SPOR domain-containing protein [Deltaproteobacteria bacterium]
MTTYKKILIGGLGALTPILMNLLVVDLNILLVNLTFLAFLGYIIRVVILFYLGGLVAYLHRDENSPVKLFELGIAAPALITALLNAGHVEVSSKPIASILIPSVYAQTEDVKRFSLPEETRTQQLWRGLTGSISTPQKAWSVIVGSHLKLEDAKRQAHLINQEDKGFKAEVYAPYKGNPHYAVVIGANLTYEEAKELRQKAIAAGLPKDTYLWTFPR